MRDLRVLDAYRIEHPLTGDLGNEDYGAFVIVSKTTGHLLTVLASADYGWDHVSVTRARNRKRPPRWEEMEQVRRMFFKDDECVMQLHAPIAEYVDGSRAGDCAGCLHLWRPHEGGIPRPPMWMITGILTEDERKEMLADFAKYDGGAP